MTEQEFPTRRTATRAPLDKPIRLQVDDATEILAGRCLNISIGGFFVALSPPRPPGTLARFEVVIDEEISIRGIGEVAWMRSTDMAPDRPIGMGIKFRHLDQRDRQQIFKLVSQHIKDRLANRHQMGSPDERSLLTDASPEPVSKPSRPTRPPTEAPPVGTPTVETQPPETLPIGGPPSETDPPPLSSRQADPLFFDDARGELPETGPELDSDPARNVGYEEQTEAGSADLLGWDEERHDELLYDEDELDDHDPSMRPGPRHDFPWLPVLALLFLVLAALLFVFRDRIFGGADQPPEAATSQIDPSPSNLPSTSEEGAADGANAPPSIEPAPEEAAGAASDPDEPSPIDDKGAAVAAREPPPSPSPSPPPPTAADIDKTAEQAKPEPPKPPPASPFSRIIDISWTELPQGIKVVITADGRIPPRRFKHSRLDGGSPREVIRFFGVREKFDPKTLEVGGPVVSRIRTGFHRKPGGNELHVVIDLTAARYRVTKVSKRGSRLEIEITTS